MRTPGGPAPGHVMGPGAFANTQVPGAFPPSSAFSSAAARPCRDRDCWRPEEPCPSALLAVLASSPRRASRGYALALHSWTPLHPTPLQTLLCLEGICRICHFSSPLLMSPSPCYCTALSTQHLPLRCCSLSRKRILLKLNSPDDSPVHASTGSLMHSE